MRIYSKFRDYYDFAYPHDQIGYAYNRITKSYQEKDVKITNVVSSITLKGQKRNSKVTPTRFIHILGFCGKIYPIYLKDRKFLLDYNYSGNNVIDEYPNIFHQNSKCEFEVGFWYRYREKRKHKKEYSFEDLTKNLNIRELDTLFLKYKTPIFIFDPFPFNTNHEDTNESRHNLHTNINLENLEFFKIVNPYMAFQEVDMFVSNQLVEDTQPKIPVGTDEELAQSKGFDKWSFRKMKENKK